MQTQVPVFEMGTDAKPAEIARRGLAKARAEDFDAIIVDTAGRLQVPDHACCLCDVETREYLLHIISSESTGQRSVHG